MQRSIVSLVLIFAVTLATSAPPGELVGISPKDLQQVSSGTSVVLVDPIVWNRAAKKTELGLLPATYGANWRDTDGRFFLADKPAVYMRGVRGEYLVFRGGVLLPDSPTEKVRFFFVQEDQVKRGKTLQEALDNIPDDPKFFPLLDALLNWASRGYLFAMAEIDDKEVDQRVRTAFAEKQ